MFEALDLIVENLFETKINDYKSIEEKVAFTKPTMRERFRRSHEDLIRIMEDDIDFQVDFLKDELTSILILLNEKGIKIFLEKFKRQLSYVTEQEVTAAIKIAVLKGKGVKPVGQPFFKDYYAPSMEIECYDTDNIDFDLVELANRLVPIRLKFVRKVNEIIESIEQDNKVERPKIEDEIVVLKPSIWGMSINLNQLWKKYLHKRNNGR